MKAHTKEQFEEFLSQLKETNATLAFYTDFGKVSANVEEVAISLNTLNYLLGKKDLRGAVEAVWKRDPKAFRAMGILIATRDRDNKKFLGGDGLVRPVHSLFESVDGVMEFMEGTGLDEVFVRPGVKSLVDYVFGVEVGLDTNARKNRSGKAMEELVAGVFRENGIPFRLQESSRFFPKVSQALGADQKVFDLAVETTVATYLIEVNFYSGGGSKLNEVARSYMELSQKINAATGFEFVWITDGVGWKNARNKMEEAFQSIPNIYNISTLSEFVGRVKAEIS